MNVAVQFSNNHMNKQKGMAVLAISIILLILITIISLYLARSILMEQRLVNNDIRSKYAFEAAESGLIMTMEQLSSDGFYIRDADGKIISAGNADCDGDDDAINDCNEFNFDQGYVKVIVTSTIVDELNNYSIESTGFSSDRNAIKTIYSDMESISALVNTPDNPVSARSNVFFEGSGTVHNLEGHSTIWSGGDVRLKTSSSKKTFIADPGDPGYPACMDTQDTTPCGGVLSSESGKVGLDVIEYDTDLKNLSIEELFMNFFGLTPAAYKETVVDKDCADWACASSGETNGKVIWVDSDVTTNGGTFGTKENPTIVIIDGDYDASNIDVHGLLFVMGDMHASGNSEIEGALVVGGTASEGGSFDIWYNSGILERLVRNGPSAIAAGSWRDFAEE
mgnify:CR=1 FL=1